MAASLTNGGLASFNPQYDGPIRFHAQDLEKGLAKSSEGLQRKTFAAKFQAKVGVSFMSAVVAGVLAVLITGGIITGVVLGIAAARDANGENILPGQNMTFRLLHINDMHARVEGMTATESAATNVDRVAGNKTDGGWPKIFTAAKAFVDSTTNPVIFLENGDQHMGTIWHTYFKGQEAWEFLNVLCSPRDQGGAGFAACVGGLGNHEFDGRYYQLLEYVRRVNYTMVTANIKDECLENQFGPMVPGELGLRIARYKILTMPDVAKTKIAVLGYLTTDTMRISSPPPCVNISSEQSAVQTAITEIKAQGIKIIIALGHSGFAVDQTIAAANPDVDIIVGGHSHTFLWDTTKGPAPGMSDGALQTSASGAYPSMVQSEGNALGIPVVQAFWGSRFMGAIDLTFDAEGKLLSYVPHQVILGDDGPFSKATHKFADDPVANDIINRLAPQLDTFRNQAIGKSAITATVNAAEIRTEENLVGNMVCDAMLHYMKFESNFGEVDTCLMNSGGIRSGINAGNVTMAHILTILPFNNVMTVLRLTGRQLYIMAEHGVGRWSAQQGEFPQLSRFHLVFDSALPAACDAVGTAAFCTGALPDVSRVLRLYDNKTGLLIPNDNSTTFTLVTNDFLGRGGDGYRIFQEAEVLLGTGSTIDEAFKSYVQSFGDGGIRATLGDRIVNCNTTPNSRFCPSFKQYTKISNITANAETILSGVDVFIRGVVVLDARLSHRGFYLQANFAQHRAPANTSEAIFVDCVVATSSLCSSTAFIDGAELELNATVGTTFEGGTFFPRVVQTDALQVKVLCNNPTKPLANSNLKLCDHVNVRNITFPIALPITDTLKTALGMLVNFPGIDKFTVTRNENLGVFGEIGLSASGGILPNPTQVAVVAGGASQAVAVNNSQYFIFLDDGSSSSNSRPTLYPLGGVADSTNRTLRAGSQIATSVLRGGVVLDFRFSEWRLQPNAYGKSLIPGSFIFDQRLPPDTRGMPENLLHGGYLRLAGMNVLNYFTTFACGDSCRGATSQDEFDIQSTKIYEAIKQMRPAILAVQEMQNGDAAQALFVAQLNSYIGNGVRWSFIPTGTVGGDVIKVAILYDSNLVVPVGNHAILSYTNPIDKSRPSIAQTFTPVCSKGNFTIVSNHFKSKDATGCGADCDATVFGEGAWATARLEHARQLKAWIAMDPTGSGSQKFALFGDFNSYRFERAITNFTNDGWVDIASRDNAFPYSFQFDGRFGTLDYSLMSPSMAVACNVSTEWHINSPEPSVLAYNGLGVANSPYRASDHDPLLVGCKVAIPTTLDGCTSRPSAAPSISTRAPTKSPTVFTVFINEFHTDNVGVDVDESIEIAVRSGIALDRVVLQFINGNLNPTVAYMNTTLATFTKGSTYCSGTANEFSLYYKTTADGLISPQNGSPDSVAVAFEGSLAEHISYNGQATLVGGPNTIAAGDTSVPIGIADIYPVGNSLQKRGTRSPQRFSEFTWQIAPASLGTINPNQTFNC